MKVIPNKKAMCHDTRPCFARGTNGKCDALCPILGEEYAYENDGECQFCKSYNPPFVMLEEEKEKKPKKSKTTKKV